MGNELQKGARRLRIVTFHYSPQTAQTRLGLEDWDTQTNMDDDTLTTAQYDDACDRSHLELVDSDGVPVLDLDDVTTANKDGIEKLLYVELQKIKTDWSIPT